jgi:hypothetical protein
MRPPIGSEFRLYFERTLGVGCGVGALLLLPGLLVFLLLLFWAPALNLLSREDHKEWQRCIAEHGQGLKGLVPGHLDRKCGTEPVRFVWQGDEP